MALVHLDRAYDQRPHELSGGMRQRVAIARALAQGRSILLMDEPFAALDAITRDLLHEELTRIWLETGMTIIFVTHNVREAVRLSQRVLLMSSRPGRIIPRLEHRRARAVASGLTRRGPTSPARSPTNCARRSSAMPADQDLRPDPADLAVSDTIDRPVPSDLQPPRVRPRRPGDRSPPGPRRHHPVRPGPCPR